MTSLLRAWKIKRYIVLTLALMVLGLSLSRDAQAALPGTDLSFLLGSALPALAALFVGPVMVNAWARLESRAARSPQLIATARYGIGLALIMSVAVVTQQHSTTASSLSVYAWAAGLAGITAHLCGRFMFVPLFLVGYGWIYVSADARAESIDAVINPLTGFIIALSAGALCLIRLAPSAELAND